MATSGSDNYNQNRDEIIKDALILLGAGSEDDTVDASTNAFAARMLNKMVKAWNGQGIHIWKYAEGIIIFDNDTVDYTIKTASDTNVFSAGGFVKAEIGADEAAAQTVLTVDSSTGMAASDVIFIELDDDTLKETTISTVDSSTQITIASSLTSAAASGNHLYVYTSSADSITGAKQITHVRIVDQDNNERELTQLGRLDYQAVANKTNETTPTSYFVDKGRDNLILTVWPEPTNLKEYIKFTYVKSIEDFDSATDDADFPQEWLEALTYNLAMRIAPAFGKDAKLQVIAPMANEYLALALAWDDEASEVNIVPEIT